MAAKNDWRSLAADHHHPPVARKQCQSAHRRADEVQRQHSLRLIENSPSMPQPVTYKPFVC
jgi:hypothetical protein